MTRQERRAEAEKNRRYQQEEWHEFLLRRTLEDKIPFSIAFESLRGDVAHDCMMNPQKKSEIIKAWNEYTSALNDTLKEVTQKEAT